MPNYTEYGVARSVHSGGTVSQQVAPVYSEYENVPSPVRRPRPADLFANATPWLRQSSKTNYGQGSSWPLDGYGWSTTGPMSYWARVVSVASQPIQTDFGQADLKMRLKIKDSKVDLLSTFGELGQTADMLLNLFRDVSGAVKRFKSGQTFATLVRTLQAPASRHERSVANRWLEYQYGVLPTLSDIYGLAEAAVTRANEGMYIYQRVSVPEVINENVVSGLVRGTASLRSKKTVRARYKVQNSTVVKLSELGLTNPVASAYNLLPWSFVVDWAFNVGDFLEGFDALLGVTELTVIRGYGHDISCVQTLQAAGLSAGLMSYQEKVRRRLGASNDLSFGSPRIENPFGGPGWKTRLANAGALLQQFRR